MKVINTHAVWVHAVDVGDDVVMVEVRRKGMGYEATIDDTRDLDYDTLNEVCSLVMQNPEGK